MKPLTFKDILPRGIAIPPVTGVRGSNAPHANLFDGTGTFRDRSGSQKRPRRDGQDDLLDAVYDLTRDFPPVAPPERPAMDISAIKTTLIEAMLMANDLRPILEKDDETNLTPAESKSLVKTVIKLVSVVECLVEKGVDPISAMVVGVGGGTSGRGFAAAARRAAAPPPPTQT